MAAIGGILVLSILVIFVGGIVYIEFRENFPIVLGILIGWFATIYILFFNPSIIREPLNYELNKYHYITFAKIWGLIIGGLIWYKIGMYVIKKLEREN